MQEELDKRRYKKHIIIASTLVAASVVWFCIALSKTSKDSNRVRSWVEVPCLIKDVKIDIDHISRVPNFFWVISYAYEYDGRQYTSSRYAIVEKNKVIGGKEEKAIIEARRAGRRVKEPYSVGDESVCFVNSENPSESVLVCEVRGKAIFGRLLLPGVVTINNLILLLRSLWRYWFCC